MAGKEAQAVERDDSLHISAIRGNKSGWGAVVVVVGGGTYAGAQFIRGPITGPSFPSNYPVRPSEFICIAPCHKIITLPNNFHSMRSNPRLMVSPLYDFQQPV